MQKLRAIGLIPQESLENRLELLVLQSHGMQTAQSDEIEALTEKVIGCAMEVHRVLGPGLLESIYRNCLVIEMREHHLRTISEHHVNLTYKGHQVAGDLILDLMVENRVIIEVKAVERVHPVHLAQVITYLKLTGCPAGLLLNFNSTSLRAGLKRLVHPDLYVKKNYGTAPV